MEVWPVADWALARGELLHRGVKDALGAVLNANGGQHSFWGLCPGRGSSDAPHWALQPLPSVRLRL
jgi:hypothetical protein